MASQSSPNEPPKGPNWIERLAQRSTGLAKEKPTPADSQKSSDIKDLSRSWQFASIGLQFAGTVLIFFLIGRGLDRYMHWERGGTLVCIVIAVFGNTYLLIKEAMKANRDQDRKP